MRWVLEVVQVARGVGYGLGTGNRNGELRG